MAGVVDGGGDGAAGRRRLRPAEQRLPSELFLSLLPSFRKLIYCTKNVFFFTQISHFLYWGRGTVSLTLDLKEYVDGGCFLDGENSWTQPGSGEM